MQSTLGKKLLGIALAIAIFAIGIIIFGIFMFLGGIIWSPLGFVGMYVVPVIFLFLEWIILAMTWNKIVAWVTTTTIFLFILALWLYNVLPTSLQEFLTTTVDSLNF